VVRTQTDCDVAGFVWYEAVECNSCSSSSHNKFTIQVLFSTPYLQDPFLLVKLQLPNPLPLQEPVGLRSHRCSPTVGLRSHCCTLPQSVYELTAILMQSVCEVTATRTNRSEVSPTPLLTYPLALQPASSQATCHSPKSPCRLSSSATVGMGSDTKTLKLISRTYYWPHQ
jgi:hypothetical protein